MLLMLKIHSSYNIYNSNNHNNNDNNNNNDNDDDNNNIKIIIFKTSITCSMS